MLKKHDCLLNKYFFKILFFFLRFFVHQEYFESGNRNKILNLISFFFSTVLKKTDQLFLNTQN